MINKKAKIIIIIVAVICGVTVGLLLLNNVSDTPVNHVSKIGGNIATVFPDDAPIPQSERGLSFVPSQEGVVIETIGSGTRYHYPEGYEERVEIEVRGFIKSIDDNIIGEIDSQTQPVGISPETTIIIERGGYDLVIKGALFFGCTGMAVYNTGGMLIASREPFMIDGEFRIQNIPPGEYRVVVERLDHPEVNVNCLMVIMLELTRPKIDSPPLTAKSQIKIKNTCDADLVFKNNGNLTIITANGKSLINLTEGANNIVYYLKDGENFSPEKTYTIVSDTTPPVIILDSIMEKYKGSDGRIVFNMRVNEEPAWIKINGEKRDIPSYVVYPGHDGSFTFAHIEDISVKSIVVEASDLAGNVTKTRLHKNNSERGLVG